MDTTLASVHQFHQEFDIPVNNKPTIPGGYLRIELLQEELNELYEACYKSDLVKVADALADLQVVLDGAFLEYGMGKAKIHLVAEAMRANMTKKELVEIEEEQTQEEKDLKISPRLRRELKVIKNNSGKVLKGNQYVPPDFKSVLEQMYGPIS